MKLFHLVLWQLTVAVVVCEHRAFSNSSNDHSENESRYKREPRTETLTLNVKINGKSKVINLVTTNQLLANGNLPVWTSSPSSVDGFVREPDIMNRDVGPFTMYHDYATSSAVVYFHKRRELDGIIDMMYKIEGLSIDKLDEEFILDTGFLRSLNIWEYFGQSYPTTGNSRAEMVHRNEQSRLKVYPELLIAISYDMIAAIESKSQYPIFVKTISHVITVYNAVDMLFKFVQSADISVNIAAIVVETSENEWGLLSRTLRIPHIDANKINRRVRTLFRSKENIFRRYSFDYIVYHTRRKLMNRKLIGIHGIADGCDFKPSFMPDSNGHRHNLAVVDHESYEHYTTIAHKLSHIFGANHDRVFNWIFQSPSDRSVMAGFGIPNLSLKWSHATEKELAKFFSSPAHCILRNEPQSLLPEEPRIIFTVEQQCQCYGYESDKKETKVYGDICSMEIVCLDKLGEPSTKLPFPMDGTPCKDNSNMVCWKKDCVAIRD